MNRFVIYDQATGKILRAGQCQAHDLELQAQAGEAVLDVTSVWWADTDWVSTWSKYRVDLATQTLVAI